MTQPNYHVCPDGRLFIWPEILEYYPWTPPERPRWWPPYPENRRLPLRREDV